MIAIPKSILCGDKEYCRSDDMINIFEIHKIKEEKEHYQAIVKEIDSIVAYEQSKAMKDGNDEVVQLCKEISKVISTQY